MSTETCLKQKLSQIWPHLNERSRRMLSAAEAIQLGHGGVSLVSRACGLSRVTIAKGIRELRDDSMPTTRVRREGAGRPSLISVDPTLPGALEALVEPLTRGIRNRRYAGHAKAHVCSPRNSPGKTIRSATRRLLNCFARWIIAFKGTGRLKRVTTIPTATNNSDTSTARFARL